MSDTTLSIVGSLCDRQLACSASDLRGLNIKSCVWRAVSSHSSHHPQEIILAQFSLYVHKSGLKPDLFHFGLIQQIRKVLFEDGKIVYIFMCKTIFSAILDRAYFVIFKSFQPDLCDF